MVDYVRRLSQERLTSYMAACGGDLTEAVRLYEWNCAMSGALFEILADVEVVLRNAIHNELMVWHGSQPGFWYDDPLNLMPVKQVQQVARARVQLSRKGKTESPGQVVSELSFGFWRLLLIRRYKSTLWLWAMHKGFPNLPPHDADINRFFARVKRLHAVRNRIAHHEQIHTRNLSADLMDCRLTVQAVCSDTEAWVMGRERVSALLAARP